MLTSWNTQKDFQTSSLPPPWIQLIKSTQLKKFGQNSSFPLFLFLLLPQNFFLHSCWFQQEKMELPVAFGTFGGVVCPSTTARAPATRSQAEKEESHVSGTLLARETWASTRRPQSNEQPFKAQKTTEFIFLALKIRKQDGIRFLIAAQGSCAASVTRDAAFHAGGHCRRAQLHQMEFKALLSNVIHSLFPGGGKGKKKVVAKKIL